MASQKQIAANRRNARRSTGPKTPEGKAAASRNAVKHGLSSSRTIVLPGENRQEFEEHLDAFRSECQPQGPLEQSLVFQVAAAECRLRRICRLETGLFADRLDELREHLALDPSEPEPAESDADQQYRRVTLLLGRVFWNNRSGDTFLQLLRHECSTRRAFYKALHELKLVQSRRAAPPPPGH